MSLNTRLDALKERHAFARNADFRRRPAAATRLRSALTRLKLEKLRLKEEMERLRTQVS